MVMGLIREHRFTAIDFESAGAARGQTDQPVQVGLAQWSVHTGGDKTWGSYLFTDRPVLWSARKVHGIGPEQLKGAPKLLELWPELSEWLGAAVIVAHGKGTEKRFLGTFPGHGFGPWVDTLWLARAAWPSWDDYSLGGICTRLGLETRIREWVPNKTWHDAVFDAAASLVLLETLIQAWGMEDEPVERLLQPELATYRRSRRSNGVR